MKNGKTKLPFCFTYLMKMFDGDYDFAYVDPYFIFGEFLPLIQMSEQLSAIDIICS